MAASFRSSRAAVNKNKKGSPGLIISHRDATLFESADIFLAKAVSYKAAPPKEASSIKVVTDKAAASPHIQVGNVAAVVDDDPTSIGRRNIISEMPTTVKIVERLTVPLDRVLTLTSRLGGRLFGQLNNGVFDLYFDNGLTNVRLTNGSMGTGTLENVLSTGDTSGGINILATGGSNVVLPTALLTTATNGFLRLTNVAGAPTGNTGSEGELAFDTVNNEVYIHVGGGVWSQPAMGCNVWVTADTMDAPPVSVIRADPASDLMVLLFGGENTKGDGTRFMFSPTTGSFCGGTTFDTDWDNFDNCTDCFLFGSGHKLSVGVNCDCCVMVGGSGNTLNDSNVAGGMPYNVMLVGDNNTLTRTTQCCIIGGSSNTISQQAVDGCIMNSSDCTINAANGSANNCVVSSNSCTIGPNNVSRGGIYASQSCTINYTPLLIANVDSVILSCTGSSNRSQRSAVIASDNCHLLSTSATSAIIASSGNCQITGQASACSIIGGSGHIITGTRNNSAVIGGQAITCAENNAVYVPKLRIHNRLFVRSTGAASDTIGRATLVGGTAVVAINLAATDHIMLGSIENTGAGTGALYVSARTNATPGSFTIVSTLPVNMQVGWMIIGES